MTRRRWPRDTLTRRFALAIGLAVGVAFALNALFVMLGGNLAKPGPEELGLPELVATITRMLDATPPAEREALTRATGPQAFTVAYSASSPPFPASLSRANGHDPASNTIRGLLGEWPGTIRFVEAGELLALGAGPRAEGEAHPRGSYLEVELRDGAWLLFSAPERVWGLPPPVRTLLNLAMLSVSILVVALAGARPLARPLAAFAAATRRFGTDPHAPPLAEQGPVELRLTIASFNAMQSRIQRFMSGQAAVFAAISHDLRTPLTRIRLRGEFIQDITQRERLFRDVEEMQAMVESALAFLRDNAAEEHTTSLDLPELLRTIADDFTDLGTEVAYAGPDHLAFPGRPVGLRRAFGNLIENAVRYGTSPAIELCADAEEVVIIVRDSGPGIPEDALEEVFAPFQRLDPSRNRHTGGVGLGLTAARTSFRAHGGDVVLSNLAEGGLQATVRLPVCNPAASG